MIQVSANKKRNACSCVLQSIKKLSTTRQGKKTSKVNKMREIWDVIVTNAENLWK